MPTNRLDQIRRSHASAKPKPENPAWFHTHNDLTFVLEQLDALRFHLEWFQKAALDVYWNYHPDYVAKLPLCVQNVWRAGEDFARSCGAERPPNDESSAVSEVSK